MLLLRRPVISDLICIIIIYSYLKVKILKKLQRFALLVCCLHLKAPNLFWVYYLLFEGIVNLTQESFNVNKRANFFKNEFIG